MQSREKEQHGKRLKKKHSYKRYRMARALDVGEEA